MYRKGHNGASSRFFIYLIDTLKLRIRFIQLPFAIRSGYNVLIHQEVIHMSNKKTAPVKHTGSDNSAPYPVSRLAPAIELVDLAKQISDADNAIANQTSGKLKLIADQIKALQSEAHRILDQAHQNQELHRASCNFPRKAGHIYHLYEKNNGQRQFSMLAPEDWGGKPPHQFIGSYRLEADMSWTPVEELAEQDAAGDVIKQLLDEQGLLR